MDRDAPSVLLAKLCELCKREKPALRRPKTGQKLCRECFYHVFETEIHNTIVSNKLFSRGDRVAIGASGGKDSTVLAHICKTLNERYDYGVEFVLLSIDEGIKGYRDDSLETVKRNKVQYGMPLEILSYDELYGWSMDEIVGQIGTRNNCTYCGVFRRQALDRGAAKLGINHIVTGHNADDMAETILMNILRGDVARLDRCTEIVTGGNNEGDSSKSSLIRRSKPFKYAYEKEIVLYAHFKNLDYFSTECTYSTDAFRGTARTLIKNLEVIRPTAIIDVIRSGESFAIAHHQKKSKGEPNSRRTQRQGPQVQHQGTCQRCGYISSNTICKACMLLEGLNKSRPNISVESDNAIASNDEPSQALISKRLHKLAF